jgi:glutathione S-transferase
MKLRYSPTSPYVRKVTVTALETGLHDRISRVPTVTTDPASGLSKDNPLGKVPALITDDGEPIHDSPVICEYLDSLHGGARLFPASGKPRWTALRRQALADGILDAAILRMLETRRPASEQSPAWIEKQRGKIMTAFDALEAEADQLGDPAASSTTIGHIAIGCACGYIDFRFGGDNWRATRPKLAKWFEGYSKRGSMSATVPKDPA